MKLCEFSFKHSIQFSVMINSLNLLTFLLFVTTISFSQGAVGIGTTNPNSASILDLGSGGKPLILPRLTTALMNNVSPNAQGMIIYNTTEHQLYGFMRSGTNLLNAPVSRWQPISTGPRMLAWGLVDSFGAVKSGSDNFSVVWDAANNWYRLTISNHPYDKDSMLLMVTPVGNGAWDQTVSTSDDNNGFVSQRAFIKFTDVSRVAADWSTKDTRRRSWFHFVVYDLRKNPY